jgi:hypothetical protein
MCFFVSLIPATIWVVLGYFVLRTLTADTEHVRFSC